MLTWIVQRVLQSLVTIWAMSLVVFVGISVIGNPVDILISPDATQLERQAIIANMGLDRPLWEQYFKFLRGIASFDFGVSFAYGESALRIIAQRFPATLELAFCALILSALIGISLGLLAGLKANSLWSRAIMSVSIVGVSVPGFWVGILLVMIFAVRLGWLPSSGRGETRMFLGVQWSFLTWDGLVHLLLPAITMALSNICVMIRLTRAGVQEVLSQEYIKFARAKGLSERRVIGVYALKNILIPIITIIGLDFGGMIAFAIVTESIFAWPGIGKLIIDSIRVLDRPMIVAYLMLTVMVFILINLVVDLIYSTLDPRISLGQRGRR